MSEPVTSPIVAKNTTPTACARTSPTSGQSATASRTKVRAPSPSWASGRDLSVEREQAPPCRRGRHDGIPARDAHRRYWTSRQLGVGSSSSSARPPFVSRSEVRRSSSQPTSSLPSFTRWSSQAPRKTSFLASRRANRRRPARAASQCRTRYPPSGLRGSRSRPARRARRGRRSRPRRARSETRPRLDRRRRDALLEVGAVKAEAVAEELDGVVLAGAVVGLRIHAGSVPWWLVRTLRYLGRPRSSARARRADRPDRVLAGREGRLPRARDRRRHGFAALGLLILWGKVAVQSLRESKRPRLLLRAVNLLGPRGSRCSSLLSVLGVELPLEGG